MCLTRNERNMFLFFLSDQCKDAKTWRKTIEWGRLAAAAKSLQSCLNLCNPIDGRAPGSSVPGILQARILEWVAIFFSSAWKWKVKVKSLRRVQLFATPWAVAYQAPLSMGFPRQEYWSGVPLPSPMRVQRKSLQNVKRQRKDSKEEEVQETFF